VTDQNKSFEKIIVFEDTSMLNSEADLAWRTAQDEVANGPPGNLDILENRNTAD
jgi:hypothetical protein